MSIISLINVRAQNSSACQTVLVLRDTKGATITGTAATIPTSSTVLGAFMTTLVTLMSHLSLFIHIFVLGILSKAL